MVTGGGGGIGSACALRLAREGVTVVVMDPGVGVEGEDVGEPSADVTARRIEAEGGKAVASTCSVTDRTAVETLFEEVRSSFGHLDIVVNTAGILRFPALVDTTEDDWFAVLGVHFDGYLNVLAAALPAMADAGRGRVVGFTSGVGLARTSAGAIPYGCAKRAVAALTWELGPLLPDGVHVNALSPIAATRMVRSSLIAGGADPNGVDLTSMPDPDAMAPAVAWLSGEHIRLNGEIIFSAGSELSLIGRPQLLEAVRTEAQAFGSVLATVVPALLQPSELAQRTCGGSNPRIGDVFRSLGSAQAQPGAPGSTCLIVSEDTAAAAAVGAALGGWNVKAVGIGERGPFETPGRVPPGGLEAADATFSRVLHEHGPISAVIVITRDGWNQGSGPIPPWQEIIDSHRASADRVIHHAAWQRATARYAAASGRTVRVVHVSGARSAAGRTAAQAVAQLCRSANDSSPGPGVDSFSVDAFSVAMESDDARDLAAVGQLVARLACTEDGLGLRGAELVAARGWAGLLSHPAPAATITFGGPDIPGWADDALRRWMHHDRT